MNTFETVDLMCFSHLRWNFVYQRPQHLMTRIARTNRIFFFEEPIVDDEMRYEVNRNEEGIFIIVPHLNPGMSPSQIIEHQREFLSRFLIDMKIERYAFWYYTPMALQISDHLQPVIRIYDCMDELSAFKFAPEALKELEKKLMGLADVVFTGGHSLYEAKKDQHHNIYPFPSSIDYDHFSKARRVTQEQADQECIPHPRFGFYGVIDERFDIQLLSEIASRKTDWHFVLIGPVVKITEQDLPRHNNIHFLGIKNYNELPMYLAGWDVAIMPFALNESTRFISPTKTPEYLAAGKPVISTPIADVMRHYHSVVNFVTNADDFILAAEKDIQYDEVWLHHVDALLAENSWDKTWNRMKEIIESAVRNTEKEINLKNHRAYV
jgi:glycosyltransferase involved in cell wall biosynthesis